MLNYLMNDTIKPRTFKYSTPSLLLSPLFRPKLGFVVTLRKEFGTTICEKSSIVSSLVSKLKNKKPCSFIHKILKKLHY